MPHHEKLGPRNQRKEKLESKSLMVSYENLVIRLRAEFINLVPHLDDMKACVNFRKQLVLNLWLTDQENKKFNL